MLQSRLRSSCTAAGLPPKQAVVELRTAFLEIGYLDAQNPDRILAELPYPRLRDAILAHPTMAEGLDALFSNVPPRSA